MISVLGYSNEEWLKIITAVKLCSIEAAASLFANCLEENKYSELLDIRHKWESSLKNKQMTREEALKIIIPVWGNKSDEALSALEALGLIKFDEEELTPLILIGKDGIELLEKNGYRIIKINKRYEIDLKQEHHSENQRIIISGILLKIKQQRD